MSLKKDKGEEEEEEEENERIQYMRCRFERDISFRLLIIH